MEIVLHALNGVLTIMLMTYERYARIPYKRHVFYRDAFFTLAEKMMQRKLDLNVLIAPK